MKEEKVSFEVEGNDVVGILTTPENETKKAVLMLHGFKGSKDEWGRFVMLSKELAKENIASLRIDMRGTGESESKEFPFEKMTMFTEEQDAMFAVDFLKSQGYEIIGMMGLSMGGLVSALANSEREITANVFWSPAIFWWAENHKEGKEEELEEKGHIDTIASATGLPWKTGKAFFDSLKQKDEEKLIKNIKAPTLIIQGDKDRKQHFEGNHKVFKLLECEKELKIIPGAGHVFEGFEEEVIGLTVDWFKKWLN